MMAGMKHYVIPIVLLFLTSLLMQCESEEDVIGPDGRGDVPTNAAISVDKSTILSGGREVSTWSVQLIQEEDGLTTDFASVTTVHMMTDIHGYFLESGEKMTQISFETNSNGQGTVLFYGAREPGLSTTLVWGDGFGLDTVTVAVIVGHAYYLLLDFSDPEEGSWKTGDTLSSGDHGTHPDSTLVRARVYDKNQQPLAGINVDLSNGEPPIGGGLSGTFKTGPEPTAESHAYLVTDSDGEATDYYYTDLFPAGGDPITLNMVAVVDSAYFGRIVTQRKFTITPP